MQVTTIVYLLTAVGVALIGLGIYGIIKDRFSQETKGAGPGVSFTLPLSALVLLMGLASLAGSGYFALNGSKSGTTVFAQPTPTVQPSGTSAVPVQSEHTGAAALTAPTYGSKVGACDVFSGTSNLPPDETLVLSARNLSDPTMTSYLEPVNNWTKLSEVSEWTGYQYFGSGNSSVGQTYEVDVLIMKTATVSAALAQKKNNPAWAVKSLPRGTNVKASVRVVRKDATGPAVCQ
jgi:hypothetical protein